MRRGLEGSWWGNLLLEMSCYHLATQVSFLFEFLFIRYEQRLKSHNVSLHGCPLMQLHIASHISSTSLETLSLRLEACYSSCNIRYPWFYYGCHCHGKVRYRTSRWGLVGEFMKSRALFHTRIMHTRWRSFLDDAVPGTLHVRLRSPARSQRLMKLGALLRGIWNVEPKFKGWLATAIVVYLLSKSRNFSL